MKIGQKCAQFVHKSVHSRKLVKHCFHYQAPSSRVMPVGFKWNIEILRGGKVIDELHLGPESNRALEKEFRQSPCLFQYLVELPELAAQGMTARRRRTTTIAGRPVSLPQGWTIPQSHTCQLFPVLPASQEYLDLEAKLHATLPNATITSIQRIQNLLVHQKYSAELLRITSECAKEDEDPPQIEHLLFHGTKNLHPGTLICSQEGFDPRMAGSQNMWGPGAYFAEDASYSDMYAYRQGAERQLLVASVALGSCFDFGTVTSQRMDQPPLDVLHAGRHHSISGITKDSRVFAVYNSSQCAPRYLIKYKV